MLLLRSTRSWGEPMFADGRIFPLSTARMVCGCAEWPIPGFTDTRRRWTGLSAGKRGMTRAVGSAQGFPALGSVTPAEEKRRDRSVPDCSDMVVARDTTMEPSSPLELGDWAGATGGPSGRPGCEEKVRRTASVGRGSRVISHAVT